MFSAKSILGEGVWSLRKQNNTERISLSCGWRLASSPGSIPGEFMEASTLLVVKKGSLGLRLMGASLVLQARSIIVQISGP